MAYPELSNAVEEALRRMRALNRLPTPPGVALRILEVSGRDDSSLDDMVEVVMADPALVAKILKFINSPLFGVGMHGASLAQAVNHIGMRGIQMIALTFSLLSAKRQQACPSFNYDAFWSRSLMQAVAAKAIARRKRTVDPDDAFIVGLLCHFGQLVLATGMPEPYEDVLQRTQREGGRLDQTEGTRMGFNHLEIGAGLLQTWGLPEIVWATIEHLPSVGRAWRHTGKSLAVLHVADQVADIVCGGGVPSDEASDTLLSTVSECFEFDEDEWEEIFEEMIGDWQTHGRLLMVETHAVKPFSELVDEARERGAALALSVELENLAYHARREEGQVSTSLDRATGLPDWASFEADLEGEVTLAMRTKRPLAVVRVDLDDYALVTERNGEEASNYLIREAGGALARSVRKLDIVARVSPGGFGVILPDFPETALKSLEERLRQNLESLDLIWSGHTLDVRVRLGSAVSFWPRQQLTAPDLLAEAEQKLELAGEAPGIESPDHSVHPASEIR